MVDSIGNKFGPVNLDYPLLKSAASTRIKFRQFVYTSLQEITELGNEGLTWTGSRQPDGKGNIVEGGAVAKVRGS